MHRSRPGCPMQSSLAVEIQRLVPNGLVPRVDSGRAGTCGLGQAGLDNRHQAQCSNATRHTGWRGRRRSVFPAVARALRRAAERWMYTYNQFS